MPLKLSSAVFSSLFVAILFVFLFGFFTSMPSNAVSFSVVPAVQDDDDEEDHDGEREHEDDEHDEEELMEAHMEMELAHLEMELERRELDQERHELGRIFQLTETKNKTAFFVIMKIEDLLDEPEAYEFLNRCLSKCEDEQIRRALRLKLAHIGHEMDRVDDVKDHLEKLILGD